MGPASLAFRLLRELAAEGHKQSARLAQEAEVQAVASTNNQVNTK